MAIPIPRLFWPVTLTAANNAIKFKSAASGSLLTYTGTVAAATYVTAEALATAVQAGFLAATSSNSLTTDGGTCTVAVSAAGYVTIKLGPGTASAAPQILWTTGGAAYVALAVALGFIGTDITTITATNFAATGAVSDYQMPSLWTPDVPAESDSGSGSASEVLYAIATVRTAGGQSKTTRFHALTERTVKFSWLTAAKVWTAAETTAATNQALQRMLGGVGASKFRYSPDRADPVTGAVDYFLLPEEAATALRPERLSPALARYSLTLRMGAYNA